MSDILFLNHRKSQCGIYEIGRRIYELLDKSVIDVEYVDTLPDGINEFYSIMEKHKPKIVFVNYFVLTLNYINKPLFKKFPNTKFVGIIHDPLSQPYVDLYERTFDYWVIHDDTNQIVSKNKFNTIRPIRRFEKETVNNDVLSIGSHGFSVSPWKMFDAIIKIIHDEFDEVNINMNITQATFGGNDDTGRFNEWRKIIEKPKVKLNITNTYFDTENELISFLSKNDMNIYFYNAQPYVGVGGSADLSISAQTSLVVNNTHMYRHLHSHIGYYEQTNSLRSFLGNETKVKELYDRWSPERMTMDYKKILELL